MPNANDDGNGPDKFVSNRVAVRVVPIGEYSATQQIHTITSELKPRHYKHKETGGVYRILAYGLMQVNSDLDMAPAVVYQSIEDLCIWIRPVTEFHTRFDQILHGEE